MSQPHQHRLFKFRRQSNDERHGMTDIPEYKIWSAMKNRCLNPDNQAFEDYGGRGITVCDLWKKSFRAFLESVGRRPSPELVLDRIDNDGNYEPGNARWTTRLVSNSNRRSVRSVACPAS